MVLRRSVFELERGRLEEARVDAERALALEQGGGDETSAPCMANGPDSESFADDVRPAK